MSGCGLDQFVIFCLVEVGEAGGVSAGGESGCEAGLRGDWRLSRFLEGRSSTSTTDHDASLPSICEEVVDGSSL